MADKPVTPERIMQFWFSFAPPLMLEAAIENRVFDALDSGPKTAEQVAAATGASLRGVRMLLDALTSIEMLTKKSGTYALTPESATFLVSTKPAFRGAMFRHVSRSIIPDWLKLTDAVRTGKPALSVNQEGTGAEFFAQFVEDLFANNYLTAQKLAEALPLAGGKRALDIAAGSGVWSIGLAEKWRDLQVTVVDWPPVIPVCQRVAKRHGVGDRYRYIPGDLLAVDYGTGYHVATLGHILHSEGEKRSRELLRKVFGALAPGGTVVIAEMVPNEERTGPPFALFFALNMLIHTDAGDTFTFAEMKSWLEQVGFAKVRPLDVPGPAPLILADKPA